MNFMLNKQVRCAHLKMCSSKNVQHSNTRIYCKNREHRKLETDQNQLGDMKLFNTERNHDYSRVPLSFFEKFMQSIR